MSEISDWNSISTLDLDLLGPLCEVLEESAQEVFDEFLSDTPRIAAAIQTALDEDDLSTIAGLVHQLKSSSGSLGGKRVQALSSWVETLAKEGDRHKTAEACQILFAAIEELLLSLRKYQQTL